MDCIHLLDVSNAFHALKGVCVGAVVYVCVCLWLLMLMLWDFFKYLQLRWCVGNGVCEGGVCVGVCGVGLRMT